MQFAVVCKNRVEKAAGQSIVVCKDRVEKAASTNLCSLSRESRKKGGSGEKL